MLTYKEDSSTSSTHTSYMSNLSTKKKKKKMTEGSSVQGPGLRTLPIPPRTLVSPLDLGEAAGWGGGLGPRTEADPQHSRACSLPLCTLNQRGALPCPARPSLDLCSWARNKGLRTP